MMISQPWITHHHQPRTCECIRQITIIVLFLSTSWLEADGDTRALNDDDDNQRLNIPSDDDCSKISWRMNKVCPLSLFTLRLLLRIENDQTWFALEIIAKLLDYVVRWWCHFLLTIDRSIDRRMTKRNDFLFLSKDFHHRWQILMRENYHQRKADQHEKCEEKDVCSIYNYQQLNELLMCVTVNLF